MEELRRSSPIILQKSVLTSCKAKFAILFSSHLVFLSRIFAIHRTAAEGRSYLFRSFLPLSLPSQTLRHQPGHCTNPRPDLAGRNISVLFFYNSEARPDTTVLGLSSKDIISLSVQDLKQPTRT